MDLCVCYIRNPSSSTGFKFENQRLEAADTMVEQLVF